MTGEDGMKSSGREMWTRGHVRRSEVGGRGCRGTKEAVRNDEEEEEEDRVK